MEHISGEFLTDPSADTVEIYNMGRKGTLNVLIGLYAIFVSVQIVIPNWKDEDFAHLEKTKDEIKREQEEDGIPETAIWKPHIWRRGTVIWISFLQVVLLMMQMEFSYSPPFGDNTVMFILLFKLTYIAWEVFLLEPTLLENLYIAPMVAASVVISNMTTMGASSFSQFVLSFFADLMMTFIERLYFAPLITQVMMMYPKWRLMLKRRFRGAKRMTRDEKAAEELEWRRINEEIELESEGIEPMLSSYADYAVDSVALIITPIINFWLLYFYAESQIASNYEILENQMPNYIMFAGVIIPFQFVCDVYLHNT
jgi:hypothetical protein